MINTDKNNILINHIFMIKKILRLSHYKKKSYLTIKNLRYLRSIQSHEQLLRF